MSVVGFDFGTDTCIISVCRRGGLDVLQNEVGNRKTSSLVAFSGNQRFIGDSAVSQAHSNWKNTVKGFKNLLRVNRVDHPDFKIEKQFLPFTMVDGGNGKLAVEVRYDYKKVQFAPQQIVAAMLQQLRSTAEKGLNMRVVDCVISVPPTWTEEHRLALLDAANIAGLNVLRLMNESSAVALTYGILRPLPPQPIKVLFCDVGASHTNAFVVEFQTGKLKVLAVDSDNYLGGRNMDKLLFDHFAAYIKTQYKMDITTNQKACLKLMKAVAKVKMTLSANTIVPFGVEYIMNDRDVKGQITRGEFEKLCQPLVSRIPVLLDSVLAKAGVSKDELHSFEIVGGGVRVPCVQSSLLEWYGAGKKVSKTCDGDESVARGCALQCAMLSPLVKVRDFSVVDVQPYDISVQWGSLNSEAPLESLDAPLFAVGDPLPCVKLVSFTDRKEPFQIVVSYSDPSALPAGVNPLIGKYVVDGFPTDIQDQHPKIKVTFNISLHGIFMASKAVFMQVKPEEEAAPAPMEITEDSKADTAAPMDTTEDTPATPVEEKKKKKKFNRTSLKCTGTNAGLDQKTRQAYYEKESSMSNMDREIAETSVARDMLERYVLEMRGRVEDSADLKPYVNDEDREAFLQKLRTEDDWLVSDEGYESQKSEYKSKLGALMKFGKPITTRQVEHKERSNSVDIVKRMVGSYQTFCASTEEKYAHITPEQKAPLLAKCAQVDQWIATELAKQEKLPLTVDPVLTKAGLIAKAKELDAVGKPVKNIAKPAPPKEEKKEEKTEEKKEEAPKTEEPAAASPEPMQD